MVFGHILSFKSKSEIVDFLFEGGANSIKNLLVILQKSPMKLFLFLLEIPLNATQVNLPVWFACILWVV